MSGDTPFEPTGDEIFFSWTDQDGNKHEDCVEETILAKLLVDEVLFVGDFDSGPFFRTEKGEKFSTVCVWVGCNDTTFTKNNIGQFGEKNINNKLTKKQVIKIKKLLKEGNLYQWQIAEKFNCSQSNISDINRGKIWKE